MEHVGCEILCSWCKWKVKKTINMKIAHCYIDVVFNIIEYQKRDKVLCVVYMNRLCKDYIQITLYNNVYLQSETSGLAAQSACSRPIYPNLPYSPYSSPNSSPRWAASPHSSKQSWYPVFRVRRRPLKVTKQASTEHRDNYMQVNVIQFHSLCQAVTKCMNEHLNFIVCKGWNTCQRMIHIFWFKTAQKISQK